MKQFEINKSYNALSKLAQMQLPIKTAYEVYKLAKKIDEPYQFAVAEERKIFAKYGATVKDDGTVEFKSVEDRENCQKDLNELNQLEHDIKLDVVVIKTDDLLGQTMSPVDMFALEGFVKFE